uniref:Uncharacterized protein n=1 Tax=Anguilla anguilla TaxID=7936 RepID=A0A0E9X4E3_ANGAN
MYITNCTTILTTLYVYIEVDSLIHCNSEFLLSPECSQSQDDHKLLYDKLVHQCLLVLVPLTFVKKS